MSSEDGISFNIKYNNICNKLILIGEYVDDKLGICQEVFTNLIWSATIGLVKENDILKKRLDNIEKILYNK